jgi:hypothetical protein
LGSVRATVRLPKCSPIALAGNPARAQPERGFPFALDPSKHRLGHPLQYAAVPWETWVSRPFFGAGDLLQTDLIEVSSRQPLRRCRILVAVPQIEDADADARCSNASHSYGAQPPRPMRFCAAQDWADYPIFALAAAVIATDLTPARSRELGFRRLVAPAIGGLSGSALAASMNFVGIWAVGQSMIAMFICQAYEGARIAGYICGIIVLLDTGDIPWRYAFFGRSRPRSAFSWRGDSTREMR